MAFCEQRRLLENVDGDFTEHARDVYYPQFGPLGLRTS